MKISTSDAWLRYAFYNPKHYPPHKLPKNAISLSLRALNKNLKKISKVRHHKRSDFDSLLAMYFMYV